MNIKYHVIRNKKVGTPSLWARPTHFGTYSYTSLARDIAAKAGVPYQAAKSVLEVLPDAVMWRLLMGYHVEISPRFLRVYPKLRLSVKDTPEAEAVFRDVNALSGRSTVGAIIGRKFNREFQRQVKWEKESD